MAEPSGLMTDDGESNLVCRSILSEVVDHSVKNKRPNSPEVIAIEDDDDDDDDEGGVGERDPLSLTDSSSKFSTFPVDHSPPSPCSTITILSESESDGEDLPLSSLPRNKRPTERYRINSLEELTRASRCFVRVDRGKVHRYICKKSNLIRVKLKRLPESVIQSFTRTDPVETEVEVFPLEVEPRPDEQSESSNPDPDFENGKQSSCLSEAKKFEPPLTPRKSRPKRLTDVSPNEINKLLSITDGSPSQCRLFRAFVVSLMVSFTKYQDRNALF